MLSHNDAFRRNLFLKSERLLAVDWAFLGRGPVGAELAPLVTASVAFLGVARDRWRDRLADACDLPTASSLDRLLIASAARRTVVPSESSGTPLPEDLRAAQLGLFVLRSRPIVELRAGDADR